MMARRGFQITYEVAREVGVSTFAIYSWKAKYGGMEPSEAARLHHLEDETTA
jgi:putative transposase